MAIRAGQQTYALVPPVNPLQEIEPFIAEFDRNAAFHHRHTVRNGVIGGVVAYALVKAAQNRRNQ